MKTVWTTGDLSMYFTSFLKGLGLYHVISESYCMRHPEIWFNVTVGGCMFEMNPLLYW